MSKDFVTLGNFSVLESQLVKAILESENVLTYVIGEESMMNDIGMGSVSGVDIQVPEDELEKAIKLLEEAKNSDNSE